MAQALSAPFKRLHARLGTAGTIALVSAIAWIIRYITKFGVGFGEPKWATWFDQGRYYASAVALVHGNLAVSEHHYPFLYSLVCAPFLLTDPRDPFVVPDMLLFAASMVAFVKVAQRMGISALAATIAGLLACLIQAKAARVWLDPWTTTLSAALIWWLIERTLAIVLPREGEEATGTRSMWGLGLLAGALPLVRPADIITGFICLAIAAVAMMRSGRFTAKALACVVAAMLVLWIPYGLLHLAVYGPHETPYMQLSAKFGFVFHDLPWKTYTLIVAARPWYPDTLSMIEYMPWLLLSAAGLLTVLVQPGRARCVLLVILAVAIPYVILFLAYTDLQPTGLWTFNNVHYFKWLFPLAGLMLWYWARLLASVRGAATALVALLVVIAPTCIRLLPKPVGEDQPARMLLYRGHTDGKWDDRYFSNVTITDSQGWMENTIQFHQVPDDQGEREIAIKRLFAAHPMRTDAKESPAFPQPQAPYARYAVWVSLGIPCWIKHSACRMPPAP